MYGIVPYIFHKKSTIHVGKYTSPMDPMGEGTLNGLRIFRNHPFPKTELNSPDDIFLPIAFRAQICFVNADADGNLVGCVTGFGLVFGRGYTLDL